VLRRLSARQEIAFFRSLHRAAPALSTAWWAVLVARGVMPVALAIASGILVGAVEKGSSLAGPLALVGVLFVLFQVLTPLHQAIGSNLGNLTGAWLNDRLIAAATAPPGIAHLERPALASDLSMARDFDLGITGPPLSIAMGFISGGLVGMVAGLTSAVVLAGFAWWAPLVLIAGWGSTHWLLRESAVWRERNTEEVRAAQRHADYAYRLAVDAPAAKELRLFGLAGWVVERFAEQRRHLYELQWRATPLRERPLLGALLIVLAANAAVFWALGDAGASGRVGLGELVVYVQTALGASLIAFGGLSWALDGAAAPVAAVTRLEAAMAPAGALRRGTRSAAGAPRREIRFRGVSFAYQAGAPPVLDGLELVIPAGTSLAIVGRNGAGKTTLAKLLCRLYDPTQGALEVDGVDLCELDLDAWRSRVSALFQDYVRFDLTLRENVAPQGAPDAAIKAALRDAGAAGLAALETTLSRAYPGGIELSGGQWQRVALARCLLAARTGAGLVLLDEPTAQLDVRGEATIFRQVLEATRGRTTILVSHRFSTVRLADRICVLEHGRVVEMGTHAELMAAGGRYRTMFDLQASRFVELDDEGREVVYDTLA
jgi:ATP-binding cassette, subfamily B, bacterial